MSIEKVKLWRMDMNTRYGDMDAQGHINNLAYLEYIQECRVQWIISLKLSSDYESVIVNTQIEYVQELIYPTPVTVIMTGSDPGRSSLMTYYEIRAKKKEEYLSARGSAKIVFIDPKKRKSVSMPEIVRKKLE